MTWGLRVTWQVPMLHCGSCARVCMQWPFSESLLTGTVEHPLQLGSCASTSAKMASSGVTAPAD